MPSQLPILRVYTRRKRVSNLSLALGLARKAAAKTGNKDARSRAARIHLRHRKELTPSGYRKFLHGAGERIRRDHALVMTRIKD